MDRGIGYVFIFRLLSLWLRIGIVDVEKSESIEYE